MTERATGAGRRIEDAIAWVIRNLDGVIGIGVALGVGLVDLLSNSLGNSIVPPATLLVLASLVYGSLAERSSREAASLAERNSRMADIREVTEESQRALEDLAMVQRLFGDEIRRAHQSARQGTDRWAFKGGTGTYLRAVTLKECVQEAKDQRRSLTIKIDIVNPADQKACETYARLRQTLTDQRQGSEERWTPMRTRKEAYATVLAACWHRQRLNTLDIAVHLSSVVSLMRFDLSSSCLIITQEDPQRPALMVRKGTPLYAYYETELLHHREQALNVNLRNAIPVSEEPSVDEIHRLFDALDLPLPQEFTDRDVNEIAEKALNARDPYRT